MKLTNIWFKHFPLEALLCVFGQGEVIKQSYLNLNFGDDSRAAKMPQMTDIGHPVSKNAPESSGVTLIRQANLNSN